jgi:tryptophan-rich sensory protein
MDRKSALRLIAAIVLCELVGGLGSVFTIPAINTWYAALSKPAFNPPNWLFGPVWTMLYLIMGVALYLVWERGVSKKGVAVAMETFGVQLFLNFMWSVLFFGLRSPLYGLIGIAFLFVAILATAAMFFRVSRAAGMLMLPYLAWVAFAALLNFYVFILN